MTDANQLPLCPACRKGRLHEIKQTRTFRPHGKMVEVELLSSRCDACGVPTTRASQHDENLRRLAARKPHYGNLLMGEEIVALRKRYGLTQQAASRLFGKGKIAFSRYENEITYPDEATTLLLTLAIERPDALSWLAYKSGVTIPLWNERRDDGRMPLRLVRGDPAPAAEVIRDRVSYQAPQTKNAQVHDGWQELQGAGLVRFETYSSRIVPARGTG